jgi:metal-responsive CopG/Arc/MetJ family transcriptional regulator
MGAENWDKLIKLLKNKTKTVCVRLNPKIVELLDEIAKEEGVKRSDVIEKAILKYLDKKGLL